MLELDINVNTTVICGDWHGDIRYINKLVEQLSLYNTTTIFHVGDVGFMGVGRDRYIDSLNYLLNHFNITLYFIEGNHEDFDWLSKLERDDRGLGVVTDRIYHIPRGSQYKVSNKIITFIGGGVSVDQNLRKKGIDWWPEEEITDRQAEHYQTLAQTDILITHDGPASCTLPLPHTTFFKPELIHKSNQHRNVLEGIREALQPSHIVFGHYHVPHSRVITLDNKEVFFQALDCEGPTLEAGKQYIELNKLYK